MTPAESTRLRQVSYERQLACGSARPGYAGTVAERFGDAAPYEPLSPRKSANAESNENVQMQMGVTSFTEVNGANTASRV
jgi:hypothetical protein